MSRAQLPLDTSIKRRRYKWRDQRVKFKDQRSQIVDLLLHADVHVVERVAVIEQLPGKIKDQRLKLFYQINDWCPARSDNYRNIKNTELSTEINTEIKEIQK